MTAHEQQDERVVLIGFTPNLQIGRGRHRFDLHGRGGFPAAARHLAAQVIGHAPRGHLNQPGAWILGTAVPRPLDGRRDQCLLHGILGGGEVAETADDRAEHLRRKFAQQMLGSGIQRLRRHRISRHNKSSGGPLITCRTSIGMFIGAPPGPGAADARAAIRYACSGLSTSTIQ